MIKTLFSEYKKAVYEKGIFLTAAGVFFIHFLNLLDEINLHPTYESGSVLYFWVNRHGLGAFSIMVFLFVESHMEFNFAWKEIQAAGSIT